ncbi:hypothetical protein QQP08_003885 [Theobroma cacao]|nr:hypothetical protein QQP08_003885 [Theobroma cacao]
MAIIPTSKVDGCRPSSSIPCVPFKVLQSLSYHDGAYQSTGGALYSAGTVAGKNICLTPSALIMGKIIPDALCRKREKQVWHKVATICRYYAFLQYTTGPPIQ